MLHIYAAMAQQERAMISRRTKEALRKDLVSGLRDHTGGLSGTNSPASRRRWGGFSSYRPSAACIISSSITRWQSENSPASAKTASRRPHKSALLRCCSNADGVSRLNHTPARTATAQSSWRSCCAIASARGNGRLWQRPTRRATGRERIEARAVAPFFDTAADSQKRAIWRKTHQRLTPESKQGMPWAVEASPVPSEEAVGSSVSTACILAQPLAQPASQSQGCQSDQWRRCGHRARAIASTCPPAVPCHRRARG
jgi:hypothetical protein